MHNQPLKRLRYVLMASVRKIVEEAKQFVEAGFENLCGFEEC